jgi:hypothetical protein
VAPYAIKQYYRSFLGRFESSPKLERLVQGVFDTIPQSQVRPASQETPYKRNGLTSQDNALVALARDFGLQRIAADTERSYRHPAIDQVFEAHKLLGGRSDELRKLTRFVKRRRGSYSFVTGPSGFGKTALLANWIRRLGTTAVPVATHFIDPGVDDPPEQACVASLCRQLMRIRGLGGGVPAHVQGLRELYCKLLCLPANPAERAVVILDGLDDAIPYWTPGKTIFPKSPPEGVKVVFSASDVAGTAWLTEFALDLPEASVLRVGSLADDEIEDAVRKTNLFAEDVDKLARAAQMILRTAMGDPSYLQRLRDVPAKHSTYLKAWWDEGCEACGRRHSLI